jgi:uncharacterized protein YdhG (YjbR/CyaY superfamily)
MGTPTTIDEYRNGVPADLRAAPEDVRRTVATPAPDAEEAISSACLAFRYRGRTLVYFAAFKRHCSFFPASRAVLEQLADELDPFRTSKGTLQFTPDRPLPRRLVHRIVKARVRELDSRR